MHRSRLHRGYRPRQHPAVAYAFRSVLLLLLAFAPLLVPVSRAQDAGSAATEFFGRGVAITVVVHDPSGEPVSSSAVVKLLRGTFPVGQTETSHGHAEIFVTEIGDFTVRVEAAGYLPAEKDVSITANGREQVDVYLRTTNANKTPVPGRPLLAPKAKKVVDDGLRAVASNHLEEAQKDAGKAALLAPGHPDVLYLQGVVFLRQRDWSKAQEALEKATQMDPSFANAFAALGMVFCNQGKYDAAVAPLEKSLQLNPDAASWDARYALAKAYYGQARYDQALEMSQTAFSSSHGKAPEIELLVAQSLTAVGRYEDAARTLREFLRDHADRREAATARHWLDRLAADGKIHAN